MCWFLSKQNIRQAVLVEVVWILLSSEQKKNPRVQPNPRLENHGELACLVTNETYGKIMPFSFPEIDAEPLSLRMEKSLPAGVRIPDAFNVVPRQVSTPVKQQRRRVRCRLILNFSIHLEDISIQEDRRLGA